MSKCTFIIPYYGHFPNYFQLFLNSCKNNPNFEWLIFTDDHTNYDWPANVHVHYETFAGMQARVRNAFPFHPELRAPYKLCDLKPMYGYLFSDYLKNTGFWGYCDCDLIFGDLDAYITDSMLENHDKIFLMGHCSLVRNTEEITTRFMQPLNGRLLYQDVLQSDRIFTFDESYLPTNVNRIFEQSGARIFKEDYSANTRARSTHFQLTRYQDDLHSYMTEAPMRAVFTWEHGHLYRYSKPLNAFTRQELMYIHLQRRHMTVADQSLNTADSFKIIPGSFEKLEVETVTEENFETIRWNSKKNDARHRRDIFKGDVKFWSKRIIGKLKK